ncbi:MAG: class I SAM-dependent methyltransferase [Candidatus Hodarchaeota archaeon]
MKDKLYKIMLKLALKFHNLAYKLSTILAIKVEGDIHPKHRLMNYHQFFIDNINDNDSVLDIGCGNGALTFDLAKKAKKVTSIDINESNINTAKKKYFTSNIEYIVGDATNYNFSEKFDAVVLSNLLEHIKNRFEFLQKIKKLAPKILIRVPMINRDWITMYKKELGIESRLDKTHNIEYTLDNFKEELVVAGLNLESYSIQFGEIWAVVK